MREWLYRKESRYVATVAGLGALIAARKTGCKHGVHVIKLSMGKRGFYLHCKVCALVIEAEGFDR